MVGSLAYLCHPCPIKKTPRAQPGGFQISQAVVTPNQVNSDDSVIAALLAWIQEDQESESAVGPFVGRRPVQGKERTHQGHSCGFPKAPCARASGFRSFQTAPRPRKAPPACQGNRGESSLRGQGIRVRSTARRPGPQGLGRASTRRGRSPTPGLVSTP